MNQSRIVCNLPAGLCWVIAAACVAGIGFLRLSPQTTRIIPIAFSIPLIVSVWFDDKRILWSMAACFALINIVRVLWVAPEPAVGNLKYLSAGMLVFDVVAIAIAVHLLIDARRNIGTTSRTLVEQNQALQTLLAATRWDAYHSLGNEVISKICSAAILLLGGEAAASAILQPDGNLLRVLGQSGFDADALNQTAWPLKNSHASIIMERGETSDIEDLSIHANIIVPSAPNQAPMRSLLATPLKMGGKISGVLEVYSRSPRKWTSEDFKIIQWLAAQASLAMEILSLQRELDHRRRQAEGESVRKTRFLAAISHDVRTPANAINLLAELMSRCSADPQQTAEIPELAREMRQAAIGLTELVTDVLDVARFDSGKLDLDISEFSLNALLDRETAQLRPLADSKSLALAVASNGIADVSLRTDRTKLARVLTNIIANAIKFTHSGSITISREALPAGHQRVHISDTGAGIPESSLQNIFDEFFQLTNPARDRSKGTGLGLAICKRLVHAMGCELAVQSTPGKGTTFTITIPRELVVAVSAVSAASKSSSSDRLLDKPLAGMSILLVEDHHPTRRATARLLAGLGAAVLQAETGSAALTMLRDESPQILLLDLMLPDIDGSEILKYVRQSPNPSLRRIFAVSGDVSPERAQQVKSLGAEDLIPKPVDIERLIARLKSDVAVIRVS